MGQSVEFQSNGGTTKGYLAVPSSGKGPALVVIQEWWGLVQLSKTSAIASRRKVFGAAP